MERGQDDALELFDRLHGELILRAQSRARRERLADGEALDTASRTLVDACRVVLDDTTGEPVRDAVFATVGRDELAEAVDAIARLGRSPDDRARELVLSRYPGVRKYLPALLDTIAFMANDAGQPVLDAVATLNAVGQVVERRPGAACVRVRVVAIAGGARGRADRSNRLCDVRRGGSA